MLKHHKDGYEFAENGSSRIFFADDNLDHFIESSPVIHRRYLLNEGSFKERGYQPSVQVQTQEHHSIFSYDSLSCTYNLVSPENAVLEETGSEETGSEETGSEETGSEETGSEETGSEETTSKYRQKRTKP